MDPECLGTNLDKNKIHISCHSKPTNDVTLKNPECVKESVTSVNPNIKRIFVIIPWGCPIKGKNLKLVALAHSKPVLPPSIEIFSAFWGIPCS